MLGRSREEKMILSGMKVIGMKTTRMRKGFIGLLHFKEI